MAAYVEFERHACADKVQLITDWLEYVAWLEVQP